MMSCTAVILYVTQFFDKMAECQEALRKEVAISSQVNSVPVCTDMTTDDVNKNSF
jgi:hypothetical protein